MFRSVVIPSCCVAVVVHGWHVPMVPSIMPTFAAHQRRQQQRRRRIMSIVHSQVFDDEECLDLCPSDTTTSHMGNADTTVTAADTAAADTAADTAAATTRMTNTNATIATPTTTMAITQDDELVPGPRTQRSTSYLFDQDDEQCLDLCNLEESTDEPAATAAPPQPQPPQQQVVKESSTMTGVSQSSNTTVATERSNLVQSPPPPPQQEQQKEQQHAQQHPKEQALKVERARIRLEMAYELFQTRDDCDLDDISTCASPCQDCQGTGTKPCRGCRGAKMISFVGTAPTNPMPCPVCNQKGMEPCSKCRGSGQIASWTELANFNPEQV